MNKLCQKTFSVLPTNLKSYHYVLTLCLNSHKGQSNWGTKKKIAFNQVSASLFHCCVDMHIPNKPVCFPHTTIDSKHDFTNPDYIHTFGISCIIVYNVSVKLTNFRMWKKILEYCCSPSVKVNTHTKKML